MTMSCSFQAQENVPWTYCIFQTIRRTPPLENQDGGVGRNTVPPRTTRTDGKSNDKGVRHQGNTKQTFIHTGRRGGDRHQGGEDSPGCGRTETGGVWDERRRQSDH